MNFIQNHKKPILIVIIVFILLILYVFTKIKQQQEFLSVFYPPIDEKTVSQIENDKINDKTSSQLFVYFYHRNSNHNENLDKSKYWNQICLFYKSTSCINLSNFWGLEKKDDNIRKEFFITNTYIEDKEWSDCKKYYYLLQSTLTISNKTIFLNNYDSCKFEYYNYLPILNIDNNEKRFKEMIVGLTPI